MPVEKLKTEPRTFLQTKKQLKLFAMKLCPFDMRYNTNSASTMPDFQYVK